MAGTHVHAARPCLNPPVRCMGKGRKERATPLTGLTVAVLRGWLAEHVGEAHDPLYPTRTGKRLSHDAIERRLAGHLATAPANCPEAGAHGATPGADLVAIAPSATLSPRRRHLSSPCARDG